MRSLLPAPAVSADWPLAVSTVPAVNVAMLACAPAAYLVVASASSSVLAKVASSWHRFGRRRRCRRRGSRGQSGRLKRSVAVGGVGERRGGSPSSWLGSHYCPETMAKRRSDRGTGRRGTPRSWRPWTARSWARAVLRAVLVLDCCQLDVVRGRARFGRDRARFGRPRPRRCRLRERPQPRPLRTDAPMGDPATPCCVVTDPSSTSSAGRRC